MSWSGGKKAVWVPLVLGGMAIVMVFLLRKPDVPRPPSPAVPAERGTPAPVVVAARRPEVPGPPTQEQILRQWQQAIRLHQAKAVLDAQDVFLAREGEYREPLTKMAREDSDPRIRAFCVAVLGRMKTPPGEAFFVERLGDAHEYPRTSALQVLERVGTSACLPDLDRLGSSDRNEGVRAAAAKAAMAVRSR